MRQSAEDSLSVNLLILSMQWCPTDVVQHTSRDAEIAVERLNQTQAQQLTQEISSLAICKHLVQSLWQLNDVLSTITSWLHLHTVKLAKKIN